MELLSYRGVEFRILRSIIWEREPILDPSGTTYLYTRWRGNVVVSYNPGATAYLPGRLSNQAGVPPNPPILGIPNTGIMPAVTDQAIRNWIEKPRGLLIVMSAGVIVLRSPGTINGQVAACDATVGPTMKVNSIVQIPGERLWEINLSIETCVNQPTFDTNNVQARKFPTIISNRWYSIDDTDFQERTVRAYQGLVTVRGDALNNPNALVTQIDELRDAFASFSVPKGFQRIHVHVRAMPDGNSAEYMVVDAQQMWNKDARTQKGQAGTVCPALRLDIQDSAWVSKWTQSINNSPLGILGIGALAALTGRAVQLVPKAYRRVNVRAWGASNVNRARIAQFCINVATARIGALAILDVANEELMCTQDTDNYVDVTLTRSWDYSTLGAIAFLALNGSLLAAGVSSVGALGALGAINSMTDNPDYLYNPPPPVGGFNPPAAAPPAAIPRDYVQAFDPVLPGHPVGLTVNPVFPASGTRGTFLQNLVTQVLEAPDTLPKAPP